MAWILQCNVHTAKLILKNIMSNNLFMIIMIEGNIPNNNNVIYRILLLKMEKIYVT